MPIVAKIQKILFTTRSLNLSPPSFAKNRLQLTSKCVDVMFLIFLRHTFEWKIRKNIMK